MGTARTSGACILFVAARAVALCQLTISQPIPLSFKEPIDGPLTSVRAFGIGAEPGVSFAFDHVEPGMNNPPNFLLLFPQSGTGSGVPGFVGLNPDVVRHMRPATYSISAVYKTTDPSHPTSASLNVFLVLTVNQRPQVDSVISSVSGQTNLSPGALVSIVGSSLGIKRMQKFDNFGFYPTAADGTTVTFNGVPAPVLRVTPERIDAQVPYEVAGQNSADVVVSRYNAGIASNTVTVPITATAPALFSADGTGSGQALIYSSPGVLNRPDNPSAAGTNISFQISGVGRYISTIQGFGQFDTSGLQRDGQIVLASGLFLYYLDKPLFPTQLTIPLTVTIGGVNAFVFSLQPVPYQLWDVLQVKVTIPDGVASGQQPIVVKIGDSDSSAQNLTVSIQ